jgi:hypothetical protein
MMNALKKRARMAALFLALLAGCGYPPEAGYVTESPPPATNQDPVLGATEALVVTESTATGVVFLVYDPSAFSGNRVANEAYSLDETIVRVVPATSEGTIQYGAPHYTGTVFVIVGVSPGVAEIEVSRNGENAGRVGVRVVAQER